MSRQTVYNHHGDKETAVRGCRRRRSPSAAMPASSPRSPPFPTTPAISKPTSSPSPCGSTELHLQPRRQVPAQADPERRRALSRAVRRLARGRPGQDLGGACRPLRPAGPCRPSRHRRPRRRRPPVPGADQRRPARHHRCSARRRRGAAAAFRDQRGAHLPARLSAAAPSRLRRAMREKSADRRLTIAGSAPISGLRRALASLNVVGRFNRRGTVHG